MFEIVLETDEFVFDYAKEEIVDFTKRKVVLKKNQLFVKFEDEKEAYEFVLSVIYFSRAIRRVYFKKDDLVDLAGFDLSKREYKLYRNKDAISSLIVNYCFYELGLDKERRVSLIDPFANLGDIVIEASIFNPLKALRVNKRHSLVLNKHLDGQAFLPKSGKGKNKIVGVVQDNKVFKQIKENIKFVGTKIKVSQYELDWLDVKFKEGDFDYCMSYLKDLDYLEEFLYMSEFIARKKICIVSNEKVKRSVVKKFELDFVLEKKIKLEGKEYFVNIFEK